MYLNLLQPMLRKNTLYLFCADLRLPTTEDTSILLPKELIRYQQLPFTKKASYLSSRYHIQSALSTLSITSSLYYEGKRPLLKGPHSISITHSNNLLIIGIMEAQSLGIDLQLSPPKDPELLKKKLQLPPTLPVGKLLSHWVLAEATFKCFQHPFNQCLKKPMEIILENNGYYKTYHSPPFAAVSTQAIKHIIMSDPKKHISDWKTEL